MDFPIYKLSINPEQDVEVTSIALVDKPAIERNFLAFKDSRPQYFIQNEDQRIVSGPLMIPDKPIYRKNQEYGQHYVVFDKQTIKTIAINYARNKYMDQVNAMHNSGSNIPDVFLFETFLSDQSRGISPMKGFEDLADGTWFGSMVIGNDQAWQEVKAGTFRGFSVEGTFIYDAPKPTPEEILNRLRSLFELV